MNKIKEVMTKSYPEITKRIANGMKILRSIEVLCKDSLLWRLLLVKEGALDKKTKELIVLAIGVSTRCDGCIVFYTKASVDLGVAKDEFEETLGMALYMGGGPSLMYVADAMLAYEQFSNNGHI